MVLVVWARLLPLLLSSGQRFIYVMRTTVVHEKLVGGEQRDFLFHKYGREIFQYSSQ